MNVDAKVWIFGKRGLPILVAVIRGMGYGRIPLFRRLA